MLERRMSMRRCLGFLLLAVIAAVSCSQKEQGEGALMVRAWHFPDIVHAAALLGRANGTFQEKLGPEVTIDWKVFNAGPSAIEALFAGEVDIGYIGPNPAINGYVKSNGAALRIVCGASSGGAGLVVREDSGITSVADLLGKKIATPQLGNTQDVACRAWLRENGYEMSEKGGTVQVVPIRNPDQLTLFLKGEIDAAWTKEPWVARLIKEGHGRLFLDEREIWPEGRFVTAHIIVRRDFLQEHGEMVKKWIAAHVELTQWINQHPEEARRIANTQIEQLTGKALPEDVLDQAFSRTTLTYDPIQTSLFQSADWAYQAGYLGRQKPDLSGIYDLMLLNQVLREKNLEPVQ
jgi:NitT/TauT family transport system substrate-binding protein